VTAIAAHLKVGRSTLYRALAPGQDGAGRPAGNGPSPRSSHATVATGC